ncbi:MAG: J domain-containing protein [Planctomycetota bacterium]|nr:J domain-containing protein [Planctomycetota bacterium]
MWQSNTAEAVEEEIDSESLTNACLLLFGEDTVVSPAFINYLQIAGLKAAFRSMAMRNHPDLAMQIGVDAPVLQKRFHDLRQAYELLLPYVAGEKTLPEWDGGEMASTDAAVEEVVKQEPRRWKFFRRDRATPDSRMAQYGFKFSRAARADNKNHTYANGTVPKRVLRLGEFLYYHRKISWENLFSALVWQRLSRPRLGEIALEKGLFKAGDMIDLRRYRHVGEVMGEAAVRLRIIDERQLRVLLGYQKMYNCPLGRYFVEERLIKPEELNRYLHLQRHHNLCQQPKSPRFAGGTSVN